MADTKVGAHVVGHRVAEQIPRTQIQDRGHIPPARTGSDIGYVTAPGHIRCRGRESELDEGTTGGLGTGIVVRLLCRRTSADNRFSRISRAIFLWLTGQPARRSAAVIRRHP